MIHKYLRLKYVMGIILLISILFLCFTVRKTKKCVSGDCENGEGVAIYLYPQWRNYSSVGISSYKILNPTISYGKIYFKKYEYIYSGMFKDGLRHGEGEGVEISTGWDVATRYRVFESSVEYNQETQPNGSWINDKFILKGKKLHLSKEDYLDFIKAGGVIPCRL